MSDAIDAAAWAIFDEHCARLGLRNMPWHQQDDAHRDEFMAYARAAIAAYREVQWQPIETALKDGTHVMLSRGDRVTLGNWESVISTSPEYHANGTYLGQFEDGDSWEGWMSWDGGFCEETPPTHWQPLPEPPKESN